MSDKTNISSIGYCFEKKQPNFKTKTWSFGFKNIKIKKMYK